MSEFSDVEQEERDFKNPLQFIRKQLTRIEGKIEKMAVTQAQFDTDLSAFLTAFTSLIAAVDAKISSTPVADLTAEDTQIQAAAATAAAELNKLNPPAPVPTPAPTPAPTTPPTGP